MKIDLTAKLKSFEDFLATYKDGDQKYLYDGKNLLFFSLSNTNLNDRYKISEFLVKTSIDARGTNRDGQNVFHVLLGQNKNTIPEITRLCKAFITKNVNINEKDKNGQMPLQYIARMYNTDEELEELYNLWFLQENLDVTSKDNWGCTPLEFVKKFPYRSELVKRIEKYGEK